MTIFFVLPAGLRMGLYLRKREDGFPLTAGGNDPVQEEDIIIEGDYHPTTRMVSENGVRNLLLHS
jgi:hypothetical protein